MTEKLVLAGQEFENRLIIGTGKYASGKVLTASAKASGAQIATMAVKRVDTKNHTDEIPIVGKWLITLFSLLTT